MIQRLVKYTSPSARRHDKEKALKIKDLQGFLHLVANQGAAFCTGPHRRFPYKSKACKNCRAALCTVLLYLRGKAAVAIGTARSCKEQR